jgi:hypothetical protein
LERIVRDEIVVGIPDTRVFVNEGELFGGIGGSARSVAIHLQTTDTAALNVAAANGRRLLEQTFPGANVQSLPNTDVQVLELRIEPNDRRIAEVGWDRASLGTIIRALGDGASFARSAMAHGSASTSTVKRAYRSCCEPISVKRRRSWRRHR